MSAQSEIFLDKGHLTEELLKEYFIALGYFVIRSCEFEFDSQSITDVDLFLYSKGSHIERQRINVDIKKRRTPAAIERIFWTKGLQKALKLDACIVATTDTRSSVRDFGKLNDVTVLDGRFLSKLNPETIKYRHTEETFEKCISNTAPTKSDKGKKGLYRKSKSRLILEVDYSGCIATLTDLKTLFNDFIINRIDQESILRTALALISHLLIILDYLIKDLAFLEPFLKTQRFKEGLAYGNLGKSGVLKAIAVASDLFSPPPSKIKDSINYFSSINVDGIGEFFIRHEVSRKLFSYAKESSNLAFSLKNISFEEINDELKSVIFILLDYSDIERKKFVSSISKKI